MKENKSNEKKVIRINILALLMFVVASIVGIVYLFQTVTNKQRLILSPENQRAITYEQFEDGDEAIDGTDNVKFRAFFLRDLNGDGYAERMKGTCKEVGTQDTLYMEVIVQTAGHFKDGKIEINGQNFYLQTNLLKDNELKRNYVDTNTKIIEFEDLNNGTQKLLTGIVKSGIYSRDSDKNIAIGSNINNYSRDDNSIVFTGTYVAEDGTEKEIRKEVPLTVDWYGTTRASIYVTSQTYNDIENRINEETGKFTLDFSVNTKETNNQLLLSSNEIEGTIPELNGYAPIEVKRISGVGTFSYDETTRKFTITRMAETNEQGGIITHVTNSYVCKIQVEYPIEAYESLGNDSVTIQIPVSTYYEGYNNPNDEFSNPYKSNIAKATIVASYDRPKGTVANLSIQVGKYVYSPYRNYIISKEKPLRLYNKISSEETNDTYIVRWYAYTGTDGESTGFILKETKDNEEQKVDEFIKSDSSIDSMEDITTNIGIYFSDADRLLKEDGEIKVYDDDTGVLLATFTKENWNKYTENNPYKYELPVKHIKVVTSATNKSSGFYVYNIKELDDDVITTKYTKDEFEELQHIRSYVTGYIGGTYIGSKKNSAMYVAPYSIAQISLSKSSIVTQFTEKNMDIYLTTSAKASNNEIGWINGSFLVKLPEEILDIKINSVSINKTNVKIDSYEFIENENGKFIKINTSNTYPTEYRITINADVTPDPRIATMSRSVVLYASNENAEKYLYSTEDIYDVNNNLNTEEKVNRSSTSISLMAPNSLITSQTASEFDEKGTIILSPQIADLNVVYGEETEKSTVKIGVELKNNYANTISEVLLLGKIPFEGNTYVLSGGYLNSEFTTIMTNAGIEIPENLRDSVTVYYSENENPTKEISNESNGWKTKEQVQDWSKIKTYIIDFGDTVIDRGEGYTFYYTVEIPRGIDLDKISYSHHGIFFSLDTDEGKYRTQTEPNKIGIRLVEKYDLGLIKYQSGKEKLISGATYRVSELSDNEEITNTVTAVTNEQGKLNITNLYAERTYEIKEIKSPQDYELNEDTIKIIGHVDKNTGVLTVEKLEGTTKGDIQVVKEDGKDYKTIVKVEDEAKLKLQLIKYEKNTENKLRKVSYKITGEGLSEEGVLLTTNIYGTDSISGLKIGQVYTLTEEKAEGYYLSNPIKFKVENNNGTYIHEIQEGEVKSSTITLENEIPTINIELEDDRIPRFNLNINKIEKGTGVNEIPAVKIKDAKFKLFKGTKKIGSYTTDENGTFTIENLYQYEEDRQLDQTYTLSETYAPEGYAKVKDITFRAQIQDGTLKLISEQTSNFTVEGNTITLTIEDSPSFKLIKKDGETSELLPNVKFAIYNVEDGEEPARNSKGEIIGNKEIIDGVEYYTVTTNERGEITADLQEGLYKAVELEADTKYDIRDKVKNFGIGMQRGGKHELETEFAKSIGGDRDDIITSVIETQDGGFIAGGHFNSNEIELEDGSIINNNGDQDGIIIKYNAQEEVEWIKTIGGSAYDSIESLIETSDGGFIAVGIYYSNSIDLGNDNILSITPNYYAVMIIKYNLRGEVIWAKSIKTECSEINSLLKTKDDGFILGISYGGYLDIENGTTISSNGGNDALIIKYNSQGEIEWTKNIGGDSTDYINSIIETKDEGYLMILNYSSLSIEMEDGSTLDSEAYGTSALIKYSKQGQLEWSRIIGGFSDGGRNNKFFNSLIETKDGGFILTGSYSGDVDFGNGVTLSYNESTELMIVKYNADWEAQWARSIEVGSYDSINKIIENEDGSYFAIGTFGSKSVSLSDGFSLTNNNSSYNQLSFDLMMIKYSEEGNIEYAKSYGATKDDNISCVTATRDGGFLIGGDFASGSINVGKDIVLNNSGNANSSFNGYIMKIKEIDVTNTITKMGKSIGGNDTSNDIINSLINTKDGGYIAGGYINSTSVDLGNNIVLNNNGAQDGMIIKYNSDDQVEWAKSIGGIDTDGIYSLIETKDGGYIAGGSFKSTRMDLGNGVILTKYINNDSNDAMIIKYNKDGEAEWVRSFGGTDSDGIIKIKETQDEGFVVAGVFSSDSIDFKNGKFIQIEGQDNGMIVKYNKNGEVEWANNIKGYPKMYINDLAVSSDGNYLVGGINIDYNYDITGVIIEYNNKGIKNWEKYINKTNIDTITATKDGGYLIGGKFYQNGDQNGIDLGNGVFLDSESGSYNYNAMVIKYNSKGNAEMTNVIKETGGVNKVIETNDGGYIVDLSIYSDLFLENGISIWSGCNVRTLVKFNEKNEAQWSKGYDSTYPIDVNVTSIVEIESGKYLVGGYISRGGYSSNKLNLGNGISINSNSNYSKGMIFKFDVEELVSDQQEIVIENTRKEFKITTDVNEIDNIKGGSISGEDERTYEKVKYGESSTKEIKMIPNENYEIIGITVNGEDYSYNIATDGSVTMPQFENMTEDKHIVVTYSLKDNKITINKKDSDFNTPLKGAKFKLDQIDERENPVLGELRNNGQEYTEIETVDEVTGRIGELKINGTYYFVEQDGKYVPTNSKTYQVANGGTAGINNSVAWSYIPIDLTGLTGKYVISVNAEVSSQDRYDVGVAFVTKNTTAPTYSSSTNRFMYIYGTKSSTEYISQVLEGGDTYYVHLGYRKNGYTDYGTDQVTINSVKLYSAHEVTKTYNFVENEGRYESTNTGKDSTVANSYIPIDLRDCSGKYNLTVNAQISSEYYDRGYVTITEDTTAPSYSSYMGQLINISGTVDAKDYTTEIQGGKIYYLHLGYYKNASNSSGDDKFTINSIKLELNGDYLYHTEVTTGSQGKAITQIPFGKYSITEIEAPEGYVLNDEPTIVEFRSTEGAQHEFTILNEKKSKVKVHHYIKNTTTPVAKDELLEGKIGEDYTTNPHFDLKKYELQKDTNGDIILPNNRKGLFTDEEQEVIYYYEADEIPLTVHHYIEGTEIKVPLKNENTAEDVVSTGEEHQEYTTNAISNEQLSDEYELVETPENATGTYEYDEVVVTYYYKKVQRRFNLTKYAEDRTTPLEGATFRIKKASDNSIIGEYTSNSNGKIEVDLEAGTYIIKEINAPESYKVIDTENTIEINKETTSIDVGFVNEKKKGTVTVRYYVEGTTIPVKSTTGEDIADVNKEGAVGEIYVTKPANNVADYFELIDANPENASGEYIEGHIEVTYYYRVTDLSYTVNYLEKGTNNVLKEPKVVNNKSYNDIIRSIDEVEPISKYNYDSSDKETLTIGLNINENVINLYYTKKDASLVVKYIDEISNEEISERTTQQGKVDDEYTTRPKEIGGYVQTRDSENTTGNLTEDEITVIYYYAPISAGVVEKHIDEFTNELLDSKTYTGGEGQEYTTSSKKFEGYDLNTNRLPENATGRMTKDPIEVKYYYNYRTKITEKHIDKATGEEIIPNVTINGHVGDEYHTEKKEYNEENEETMPFKEYTIVEEPQNKEGKMTREPIEVIYYYAHNSAGLEVNHLDVKTNEPVAEKETQEGKEGDNYSTHEKEIEGYDLVRGRYPQNATGQMTKELTVVNYYYEKKSKVIVKYIDRITGRELTDNVVIEGHEGEDYETEEKSFDGYKLEKVPEDATGKIEKEPKTVIYYYVHNSAGVIVNHYDVETGEKLAEEERIEGHEGDSYKTHEKEIEGYGLVKDMYPENTEGTMKKEVIKVNYYYKHKGKVIVKYKDKVTGEEIAKEEIIEGNISENYETEEKKIEGYEIEKEMYPTNAKGQITKEDQEVIYYYKKKTEVIAKYVDKETGKELEEKETIKGYEGEEYKTNKKDIKNYVLIEEPKNKQGKMTKDPIEVIYYYRKAIFNLLIEKQVKEIQVNGETKKINKDIAKVEVKRKKIKDTEVKVVYTIKVTNDGELEGNAIIEENIPEGMIMLEEDNKEWNIKEDKATITTNGIKPGQSVEYTVVLTWDNSNENFGTKKNIVKITDTKNVADFKEKDLEDNEDDAQVIITLSTGAKTAVRATGITTIALSTIGVCIVVMKRRTKE